MPTLEEYLVTDFLEDQRDIASVRHSLQQVADTFVQTWTKMGWPYKISDDGPIKAPKKVSIGTVAMIAASLGRMVGACRLDGNGALVSLVDDAEKDGRPIESAFRAAMCLLTSVPDASAPGERAPELSSGTFGKNNPLTLSHVAELSRSLDPVRCKNFGPQLETLMAAAKSKLRKTLADNKDLGQAELLASNDKKTYFTNAFVPLRAVRTAIKLEINSDFRSGRTFFESTLHDQLSFSAIPDSRFDPAELAFCLEGLLLCAPHAVDGALFRRVADVMAEKQNTSAHWRPSKPFLGLETGWIILPLSVEAANSLMRSVAMMDKHRFYDTHTARVVPLIRRFWRWLDARAARISLDKNRLLGWHSEHVNQANLIHPWDTSQVAEFMMAYLDLLSRHGANETLRLSGLTTQDPSRMGMSPEKRAETAGKEWDEHARRLDPTPAAENAVYDRIGRDFVADWATGKPRSFSMLLYGPPGTGKTTVAESLSEALGMRLITVTVSDFLGSGGANVEARAKAIFQALEMQRGAVILFDEIDSFLLDRDSDRYSRQDSLFQFLTPGMLTKLNDLRKQKRSIFIVATNYENRIDAAIKRTGRIDQKYLLALPNAARRRAILGELSVSDPGNEQLMEASVLRGYSDLKAAVGSAKGSAGSIEPAAVVAALRDAKPAANVGSYLKRRGGGEEIPMDEFKGILDLLVESSAKELAKQEFNNADCDGQQFLLKQEQAASALGIDVLQSRKPEPPKGGER